MADPTLEELQAKAETKKGSRTKRARAAGPEPEKKQRVDPLSPHERRSRNIGLIATGFQGFNHGLVEKTGDPYYEVGDDDAAAWAEAVVDTSEWMGMGTVPPPVTLLAITLNIYIPKAYHFWVYGREIEEFENVEGEPQVVTTEPAPQFAD